MSTRALAKATKTADKQTAGVRRAGKSRRKEPEQEREATDQELERQDEDSDQSAFDAKMKIWIEKNQSPGSTGIQNTTNDELREKLATAEAEAAAARLELEILKEKGATATHPTAATQQQLQQQLATTQQPAAQLSAAAMESLQKGANQAVMSSAALLIPSMVGNVVLEHRVTPYRQIFPRSIVAYMALKDKVQWSEDKTQVSMPAAEYMDAMRYLGDSIMFQNIAIGGNMVARGTGANTPMYADTYFELACPEATKVRDLATWDPSEKIIIFKEHRSQAKEVVEAMPRQHSWAGNNNGRGGGRGGGRNGGGGGGRNGNRNGGFNEDNEGGYKRSRYDGDRRGGGNHNGARG